MSVVGSIAFLAALIACYFIPAIIAGRRHHANAGPIFLVNLLLGWTLLGWVGALVWACASIPAAPPLSTKPPPAPKRADYKYRQPAYIAPPAPTLKTCPRCAEDVKTAALACRYCGHEFTAAAASP